MAANGTSPIMTATHSSENATTVSSSMAIPPDRDTWDAEASKYAFEGHDSWLWNLVLANLEDDLKRCAANFRSVMTNERILSMLNDEQSGNWCDRAIQQVRLPEIHRSGYQGDVRQGVAFIYALQEATEATAPSLS